MEKVLKDRVALIVGASRGIGEATARLFAAEGAKVVLSARGEKALKEICESIEAAGGEAVYRTADAEDLTSLAPLAETALSVFGRIDILLYCSGIALREPTLEMDVEKWERVMRVNLTAAMEMSRICLRQFLKQGGGKIVYVSSTAGKYINMGASPSYGASKAGMIYLTRHLATEFAKDNIRVNAVCPGPVETEIVKTWTKEHRAKVDANLPTGRMSYPEDIANAILFLASPMADQINGESLMVNGGRYMD